MKRKKYVCANIAELGEMDFWLSIDNVRNEKLMPKERCIYSSCVETNSMFAYIAEGDMGFCPSEGNMIHASKGDVVYIPGDAERSLYSNINKATELFICTFNMVDIEKRTVCLSEEICVLASDVNGRLSSYFPQMHELYETEAVHSVPAMKSVFYQFLSELIEMETYGDLLQKEKASLIYPGIEYIRERYLEDFKVEALAEICNVSEPTFRRLFKCYCGEAPMRYKNRLKLEHAKKLLETGVYTVAEVAEITNFSDISYFTKSFKAMFGKKPSSLVNRR